MTWAFDTRAALLVVGVAFSERESVPKVLADVTRGLSAFLRAVPPAQMTRANAATTTIVTSDAVVATCMRNRRSGRTGAYAAAGDRGFAGASVGGCWLCALAVLCATGVLAAGGSYGSGSQFASAIAL